MVNDAGRDVEERRLTRIISAVQREVFHAHTAEQSEAGGPQGHVAADEKLLRDGMAAAALINIDRHAELLRGAGFEIEAIEDESDSWAIILAERLRMYQSLRGEAEQAGTPAGHDDFFKSYVLFVSLVQQKIMGGARFAAVKPA